MTSFVGMQEILFGSWAPAATGSLVDAVWQGIALAVLAAIGLRLLPKTPAAVRFAIWFAVFLVVVALPGVAIFRHREVIAKAASGAGAWLTLDTRWSFAIAAVWAVASLMRAVTLISAALRVRELWQRATPIDVAAIGRIYLGRAQLCVSDEVDRPTVIGFFSPKIVMPAWLIEKLTAVELEQIVLHEAGHLGRADDWMNLLQKIALVVFPLNPALLWVERRLCFERELACDERVLRTTRAPKAYATCLAALAEYRLGRRGLSLGLALGFVGALGRESELGQRIGRILRREENMLPRQARLVMSGAMLGLLAGAVGLARCPHVVAFSGATAQVQAASASIAPMALPAGYRYQPVVFHPAATHAQSKPAPRAIAHIRIPPIHVAAAKSQRGTQWEVTTWQAEDGSRMTLTTQRRRAFVASPLLLHVSASPEQDTAQEFHPYAAVPVRDGWLFFQL